MNGIIVQLSILVSCTVTFRYSALTCHQLGGGVVVTSIQTSSARHALLCMLVVCVVCVCVSVLRVAFSVSLLIWPVERAVRAGCVIEMSCVQERSLTEREPLAMPQRAGDR